MVRVRKLYKQFGNEGIRDISFEIDEGDVLLIIGRSGSGKTLLLKILLGLVNPDSGDAYINNINVTEWEEGYPSSVRKETGVLFQNSALFDSMNVRENLCIPMKYNDSISVEKYTENIAEMLETVDLAGSELKRIHELSGGMKRRVAIARALINDPSLIFYDEPVTGLDPMTGDSIIKLIKKLCIERENTSVIITHDLRGFLEFADNILLLENGRRHFFGTTRELLSSKDDLITKYLKNGRLS